MAWMDWTARTHARSPRRRKEHERFIEGAGIFDQEGQVSIAERGDWGTNKGRIRTTIRGTIAITMEREGEKQEVPA